ncbi:MAG: hypothetical protein QXE05_09320 [Nitrososphaeria archaeon]
MNRKSVSPIISTVILTAIMLTITFLTIGFAITVFAIQSDTTEFEQAKNVMTNFAGIIDYVSSKQGSSAYVKFNSRSGGPQFLENSGEITVNVDGTKVLDGSISLLKYRGGSLSSVAGKYYLRGTDEIIVVNNTFPLGSVYVEQANGAYVILDFSRINVANLGTFQFYSGKGGQGNPIFEKVNLIQINFVNLTKGVFYGSGSLYAVATCEKVNITYYRISKGPNTLTITASSAGQTTSVVNLSVDTNCDTIVMVTVSNVKVSVIG